MPSWVAVGSLAQILPHATMVIWLDYPLSLTLKQGLRRARERGVTVSLNLRHPGQSWFLWIFRSWFRLRRTFRRMQAAGAFQDVTLVHLRSPGEGDDLLKRTQQDVAGRNGLTESSTA